MPMSPAQTAVDEPLIHALVIDDDDVDRERLARLLKRCSTEIRIAEAASKTSALAELRGRRADFSFIFLDFKLDDGDGRELLPDIWESVGSDCVVIAVTGCGTERAAAEAIKLGIHEYLSKGDLSAERVASAIDEGLQWIEVHRRMRAAEQELVHKSLHDALTDLPNRHVFFDRLERQCATFRRDSLPFAVLMMDLDRFKQVNDQLGHAAGDQLLIEVGRRLGGALREVDTVARLGGDEFAVLLPGVPTLELAESMGRRLVDALERAVPLSGGVVSVGASLGIAVCPQHGNEAGTLMNRADNAMYRAKRGLDKVVLYDSLEPSSTSILDRIVLLGEVELALQRQEFQWYSQPKVHLPTRRVVGFEALARWTHSRYGPIPADTFITAIEDSKLVLPFTLATVEQVLGQLQQLERLAPDEPELGFSVNVSARVLQHGGFVDELLSRLDASGVDPRRLVLELTETALISNPVQAKAVLERLSQRGVALAIDDFGAGFTSFGYLRDFTVREIKLDKSYILNLAEQAFDQSLVSCLAVFCRSLGLRLLAEGVENDACWRQLLTLGCEYGQGYGIGRPMPFEAVPDWLAAWGRPHH